MNAFGLATFLVLSCSAIAASDDQIADAIYRVSTLLPFRMLSIAQSGWRFE